MNVWFNNFFFVNKVKLRANSVNEGGKKKIEKWWEKQKKNKLQYVQDRILVKNNTKKLIGGIKDKKPSLAISDKKWPKIVEKRLSPVARDE